MASYDDDRRELYDLLEAGLGSRGAGLLMAQLPPAAWTELATKADIAELRGELKDEIAEVKVDMAELKGDMAELKGQLSELRGEFKYDLAAMKTSVQVTSIGSMIGLAGLVFAVASFAR